MLHIAPLYSLFLLLDVQTVLHNEFPGFELLIPLDLAHDIHVVATSGSVLGCHVEIDSDPACVLCLQAEAVDQLALAIAVHEGGSDDFFEATDADGSSEEEGVDLCVERGSGSPGGHAQGMVALLGWEPQVTVPFYSVAAPAVG